MKPTIELDPTDPAPLWSQLAQQLRQLVVSGQLPPGAPVPSVRVLAQQLTLNPATVAKALQALVVEGILQVRRGQGTFVAPSPPQLSPSQRWEQLLGAAKPFVARARALGATLEETQQAVAKTWLSLNTRRGGES